jgi:hypothetical protein
MQHLYHIKVRYFGGGLVILAAATSISQIITIEVSLSSSRPVIILLDLVIRCILISDVSISNSSEPLIQCMQLSTIHCMSDKTTSCYVFYWFQSMSSLTTRLIIQGKERELSVLRPYRILIHIPLTRIFHE